MRYIRQESIISNLKNKTVSIVGVGALGTYAASLLARAGINLILIDHDIVQLDNLQRQALFDEKDINELKVIAAKKKLKKINSEIKIKTYAKHLDSINAKILKSDLILDCTDNFETRRVVDKFCKNNNILWIHAAATNIIGNVLVVDKNVCFDCIYHSNIDKTCDTDGILNSLISLVSSIQVTQAYKILTRKDYSKNLIHINIWNNKIDEIKLPKKINCKHEYEENDKIYEIEQCLTKNIYKVKPLTKVSLDFDKIKTNFEVILDKSIVLVLLYNDQKIIVHKYGGIEFYTNDLKIVKKLVKKIY